MSLSKVERRRESLSKTVEGELVCGERGGRSLVRRNRGRHSQCQFHSRSSLCTIRRATLPIQFDPVQLPQPHRYKLTHPIGRAAQIAQHVRGMNNQKEYTWR
jgi:hypothetical protein